MEVTESKNEEIDILHPELMSKESLIDQLDKRNVKTAGLRHLEKGHLIELYYSHVIPMPQRKYRKNRRGQAMTRQQNIIAKRKRTFSEMSESSSDKSIVKSPEVTNKTCGLITSFNLPQTTVDRLKPPPSTVNFDKKVIKLGTGKVTSGLDSLSIKSSDTKTTIKLGNSNNKTLETKLEIKPAASSLISPQKQTVKITKILPQRMLDPKPSIKIKLKRPATFVAEPTDTAHNHVETNAASPEEKEEACAEDSPMKEDHDNIHDEDSEIPEKRFKRVSVQWP